MILFLVFTVSLMLSHRTHAQTQVLTPPLIKTINKNMANDELFYAGGFSIPDSEVILFLQNLDSGETTQINVKSDKNGEWFYRQDQFLNSGSYLLWGQSKVAGQISPPTGQIQLNVDKRALQFGANKISQPTLYLMIIIILLLVLLVLGIYIFYHYRKARHKHRLNQKRIQDAESSIKRGFAVLNRDIQAELALVRNRKPYEDFSAEELRHEEQLLADLENIQQHVAKEVWDLEEIEKI